MRDPSPSRASTVRPDGGTGSAHRWRCLTSEDLDAVYALHLAATEAVGRPDLIRPETRAFFAAILDGGGSVHGVEDDDGLLAYGVLQWDLPPAEDLRGLLGLPPDAPFAKLAGASVRPGDWGGGLHEALIAARVAAARVRGLTHLYATSAPGNARSWTNLLSQGFVIRALVDQYGGYPRYILYRRSDRPAVAADKPAETWVSAGDGTRERALLAGGLVGARWRRAEGGRREVGWVKGA